WTKSPEKPRVPCAYVKRLGPDGVHWHDQLSGDIARTGRLPESLQKQRSLGEICDCPAQSSKIKSRLRSPFSVPGHRSVIMFGVLVVVFRRDNVARPGFFLG